MNNISRHTVGPIEIQVTMTGDPMVFLRQKVTKYLPRNILLNAAAYDAIRKPTVLPIQ